MNCQQCGKELEQLPGGHRSKQFCNNACRQKHYRSHKPKNEIKPDDLASLEQERDELVSEVSRLRGLLDIEKRLLDGKPRGFKSWLRNQPKTPFIQRLLDDPFFPAQSSLGAYQLRLRYQATETEMEEFMALWKLMLLSRP